MSVSEENNSLGNQGNNQKKKNDRWKYLITISIVLVLTAASLIFSLFSSGNGDIAAGGKIILDALAASDWRWLLLVFGIVIAAYAIDGLIILVFARLYTRKYHWHQGFLNGLIGAYYSAVTPGASGGQVMQVYVLKKQGVEVSSAASIMVMWFILYQSNLILFDLLAIGMEWSKIFALSSFEFTFMGFHITILPLIIIGFAINLGTLLLLTMMSYSHRFHNFILHHVINLGYKLRIVKDPEKSRESLRVQVENFKLELRRLQSNIPVTLLLSVFFQACLFLRFSIPYFSAVSLNATGGDFSWSSMFDTCFLSAFHQMVTGVFPLPGGAGVSEIFFNSIFRDLFKATVDSNGEIIRSFETNMNATQILWRIATFHSVVLVSGFIAAFYRSRGGEDKKDEIGYANRQTFLTLQLQTYEIRKASADTLYETRQLSKKQIREGLRNFESDETEMPLKRKKKTTSSTKTDKKKTKSSKEK